LRSGSDFQFKKLHAKAPQIKGIDFASRGGKKGDLLPNKFQSKNLTKGTGSKASVLN